MQKLKLCAAVSMATLMLSQSALADRVKGSAKADFSNDELEVPCVLIEGTGGNGDGRFYDIVLERRGKSFNYEMIFAEREDGDMCAEMANYARFIDDDQEDEDDSDDDESIDDSDDVANLFASCEVRDQSGEQVRSKIKVKAKDLASGSYYAIVTSGDVSVQSEAYGTDEDELEIEFDNDADDVLEGAEAIEADFIQDGSVLAEVFAADTDELLLSETVSCRVKN
jgi:hypothetical protein